MTQSTACISLKQTPERERLPNRYGDMFVRSGVVCKLSAAACWLVAAIWNFVTFSFSLGLYNFV